MFRGGRTANSAVLTDSATEVQSPSAAAARRTHAAIVHAAIVHVAQARRDYSAGTGLPAIAACGLPPTASALLARAAAGRDHGAALNQATL